MCGWRILPVLLSAAIILGVTPDGDCAKPKTPTPRVVRVDFFELTSLNIDELKDRSDLYFKADLERIIENTLKAEGIHVERVRTSLQGYILDEGRYSQSSRADFILKGTFTSLYNNQFDVSIRLLRTRGGSVTEVLSAPVSRVPKEVAQYVLVPWFKYLSSRIANLIKGRPSRQTVLTHCFDTYVDDNSAVKELAQYLAVELAGELESGRLGSLYQVMGFQERGEVIQVCDSKNNFGSYLDLYDFVISGDVRFPRPGQVTIGVRIRTGGKSKLRETLTSANDLTRLVGELGQFIVTRWSVVTAK